MDIHLLTPQGDQLVVQVVDDRVTVPSSPRRLSQHPADERESGAALCQEPRGDAHACPLGQRKGQLDVSG